MLAWLGVLKSGEGMSRVGLTMLRAIGQCYGETFGLPEGRRYAV